MLIFSVILFTGTIAMLIIADAWFGKNKVSLDLNKMGITKSYVQRACIANTQGFYNHGEEYIQNFDKVPCLTIETHAKEGSDWSLTQAIATEQEPNSIFGSTYKFDYQGDELPPELFDILNKIISDTHDEFLKIERRGQSIHMFWDEYGGHKAELGLSNGLLTLKQIEDKLYAR